MVRDTHPCRDRPVPALGNRRGLPLRRTHGMKISLNWLNDYVQTDGLQAERIAEILSDLGLPCEGIEPLADDVVIDVEITSNRGDCLSHIGIARELAAATGRELRLPKVEL